MNILIKIFIDHSLVLLYNIKPVLSLKFDIQNFLKMKCCEDSNFGRDQRGEWKKIYAKHSHVLWIG